jgi:hypothetical protein
MPRFETLNDGLYGFDNSGAAYSGNGISPVGGPASRSSRYIGSMGDLEVRWAPVQHVIFAVNLAGMTPGSYISYISPGGGLIYSNMGVTYRF